VALHIRGRGPIVAWGNSRHTFNDLIEKARVDMKSHQFGESRSSNHHTLPYGVRGEYVRQGIERAEDGKKVTGERRHTQDPK
jgi:hypothetical protein